MPGETKGTKHKKRKKKKFGYYLYAVVILVLTITNITLAALLLTYVQKWNVTGNELISEGEITAWVQEDPLTVNSLYTLWKFETGSYNLPIYLEDVSVSLKAPWEVRLQVTEKKIIGCIVEGESYVYFDEEGLVLAKSSEYWEGIPFIEGLALEPAEQYGYLQAENEKVFSYIVNVTKEIEKQELAPDRIVWGEDSMNLYFGDICAKLGRSGFDEKVMQLPMVLEKLEEKGETAGVLHLEHYTSDSKSISFEKNT